MPKPGGSRSLSLGNRFGTLTVLSLLAVLVIFSFTVSSNRLCTTKPHLDIALNDQNTLPERSHWVATWTAGQHPGSIEAELPVSFYQDGVAFEDTTLRQTHIVTTGSEQIRIRLSNAYGAADLAIEKATIALPQAETIGDTTITAGSSSIRIDTLQSLTFSGRSSVTIPARGLVLSDPIQFPLQTSEVISISMHFRYGHASNQITLHSQSKTTSWLIKGDQTASPDLRLAGSEATEHWFVVTAIEAWKPLTHSSVVALGDSISEGTSAYGKWPHLLFDRMQRSGDPDLERISVLNQAIGGARFLADFVAPVLGSRLDSDALAVAGVKYAILFLGINDINLFIGAEEGREQHTDNIIAHYLQIITRLHAANIQIIGCTLSPISCTNPASPSDWHDAPHKEVQRLKLNEWIRSSGAFDAVVDVDEILWNPANHTEQAPKWISGDCLHPNEFAHYEIAEKFPLSLFKTSLSSSIQLESTLQ